MWVHLKPFRLTVKIWRQVLRNLSHCFTISRCIHPFLFLGGDAAHGSTQNFHPQHWDRHLAVLLADSGLFFGPQLDEDVSDTLERQASLEQEFETARARALGDNQGPSSLSSLFEDEDEVLELSASDDEDESLRVRFTP